MNAIILAAGKSSRMFATGATIHKALLPIMGIPNIERTIMMLRDYYIQDIIITVPAFNYDFEYLVEKYSCKLIYISPEVKNTLYTINYLINCIHETFIIEGDVVCAQNIFRSLKSSCYYVMNYTITEHDAWHPILNSRGEIESFDISGKQTPALFGVSYWNKSSSAILKKHIASVSTFENLNNPNIFWDDFIQKELTLLKIETIEILQEEAFEMNTYEEYMMAQAICEKYLKTCKHYFERLYVEQTINNQLHQVTYLSEKESSLKWHENLLKYYDKEVSLTYDTIVFSDNEIPFVIKDAQENEYGYFSIAETKEYILLRRLFIDEKYRNNGFGSNIIHFCLTYARLKSKELRVNVYNKKAKKFYKKAGFTENYTCFHIE